MNRQKNKNKTNNNKRRNRQPRQLNTTSAPNTTHDQLANLQMPYRKIPKLLDPRYIDTNLGMSVTSVWTNVDITPVVQGAGDNNRTGRYTRLTNAELQFTVEAINADVFTAVRFLVVQWEPQSNNQVFTMSAVMQIINDVNSFYNVDASEGVRIIHDEKLTLTGTASVPTTSGYQTKVLKLNLSKAKRNQLYAQGTTSSFNKLFFVAISNSSVAPFPNIVGYSRVYFNT